MTRTFSARTWRASCAARASPAKPPPTGIASGIEEPDLVLARADVGVAIGTSADLAMETADVTLVGGEFDGETRAITFSKATLRTIRENFFWASFYNVALVPLAAGALAPFAGLPMILRHLHPALAAVAMALSSVTVVLNSLRLWRRRPDGVRATIP